MVIIILLLIKNNLYVKDPNEAKHQYLIIKLNKGGLK